MSIATPPQTYPVAFHEGVPFSNVNGKELLADLYLPEGVGSKVPVIIWLHGGGWRLGDRKAAPDLRTYFAQDGFAMVSIEYRLSGEAIFPAQAIDTATAVRWVRAVADQYGFDADRITLWGSSAGGHLSALIAAAPEGTFSNDEYPGLSEKVAAVVDGYGPTDLLQIDDHRVRTGERIDPEEPMVLPADFSSADPNAFESLFVGGPITEKRELVSQANPITYVRPGLPPFLILHGLDDMMVPHNQSEILYEALSATGNDATLLLLEGVGHGFFNRATYPDKKYVAQVRSSGPWGLELDRKPVGIDSVLDFLRSKLGLAA